MKLVKEILPFSIKLYVLIGILCFASNVKAQFVPIADPAFKTFIADKYPSVYRADTLGGALDTIKARTEVDGRFVGINKGFSNVDEIRHFIKLDTINFINNNISQISSYLKLRSVEYINLSENKLVSLTNVDRLVSLKHLVAKNNLLTSIPSNLNLMKDSLKRINLSYNNISDIDADFTLFDLEWLIINHNYLSFEDIMPFIDIPYFNAPDIFPQNPLPVLTTAYNSTEGELLEIQIPYDQTIAGLTYLLYQDNEVIDSNNTGVFSFTAKPTDSGTYYGQIKSDHPNIIGRSVTTQTFEVTVTPKEPEIPQEINDPVLTPNNDGVQDYYNFNSNELVMIFNSNGEKVNEFQAPYKWQATDKSGNLLKPGYYLIIEGRAKKHITIQY